VLLDGDVGRMESTSKGGTTANKGLVVVDSVIPSNGPLRVPKAPRLESDVLIDIQGFVSKTDGVFLRHNRG
jgi:hypothetical protein